MTGIVVEPIVPTRGSESKAIHDEHLSLIGDLAQLDGGLRRLECYSEVFANLAGAEQVKYYGRRLASQLPEHFRREEETVLATVSKVSPELAGFAQQMRHEHEELRARLAAFSSALEQLEAAQDLYEAICQLHERGKALTQQLGRHVALEEQELSGFL